MRWQDGYPCDTNSTDEADSSRLAGLMFLFLHPGIDRFYIQDYVKSYSYVRHPIYGNKYQISRDQIGPLFAGLHSDGLSHLVNPNYNPPNGDWISPSVRGHFIRCSGGKANWFQDFWLWLDVFWSCFIAPMAEPNQLICMMKVHPNKSYLKCWVKYNKHWRESITEYWYNTSGKYNRGESELAELMIKDLEQYEEKNGNKKTES